MMRGIRFRVYDRKLKAMFHVHKLDFSKMDNELDRISGVDIYHKDSDHNGDVSYGGSIKKMTGNPLVPRFELMQFTGLKDKNSKEIYDGDIIRYSTDQFGQKGTFIVPVIFTQGQFRTEKSTLWAVHLICEVIGNVHENPELLGVGK